MEGETEIKVRCTTCGKEFTPSRRQLAVLERGLNIYCSSECLIKHELEMKKQRRKEKVIEKVRKLLDDFNACSQIKRLLETEAKKMVDVVIDSQRDMEEKARVLLKLAIDKYACGFKVDRVNMKLLHKARLETGIMPVLSVEEVIPSQARVVGYVAALSEDGIKALEEKALEIYKKVKGEVSGSPVVLGATLVYLAAIMLDLGVTQKKVAEALGVSDAAIRQYSRKIIKGVIGI